MTEIQTSIVKIYSDPKFSVCLTLNIKGQSDYKKILYTVQGTEHIPLRIVPSNDTKINFKYCIILLIQNATSHTE